MEIVKEFTFEDEKIGEDIIIKVPEVVDPQYGMFTWPCAPVLAQFILKNQEKVHGKNVLEIGAGTALPGITAAKCDAKVFLSDAEQFSNCLNNARRCCTLNNLEENCIDFVSLTWGKFNNELFQLPKIDIILGSDCFYTPDEFENIIVTVAYLMEQNPTCLFWSTYQLRSSSWSIEYLLDKWDLQCIHIPLSTFGGDRSHLGGHCMAEKHSIQMLEIKRKS